MPGSPADDKVIPFPLSEARRRELEDLDLLPFPPAPTDTPDRMALDALAQLLDGATRLALLGDVHPEMLASLSSLDSTLGLVDQAVRRLRLRVEAHRTPARHG